MKSLSEHIFGNNKQFSEEIISSSLQNLPTDNRIVITLHFQDSLSKQQIATHLNWSLSKVNAKLTRGITLLKQELNPAYFNQMNQLLKESFSTSS